MTKITKIKLWDQLGVYVPGFHLTEVCLLDWFSVLVLCMVWVLPFFFFLFS